MPKKRRSFGFDVLACPRCPGRLTLVALIRETAVILRILRHLGLLDEVPAMRPAVTVRRRRRRRTPAERRLKKTALPD